MRQLTQIVAASVTHTTVPAWMGSQRLYWKAQPNGTWDYVLVSKPGGRLKVKAGNFGEFVTAGGKQVFVPARPEDEPPFESQAVDLGTLEQLATQRLASWLDPTLTDDPTSRWTDRLPARVEAIITSLAHQLAGALLAAERRTQQ